MKKKRGVNGKKISFYHTGKVVKLQIYENMECVFKMEAPANNQERVSMMIEAAIHKGMSKPKKKDVVWWE